MHSYQWSDWIEIQKMRFQPSRTVWDHQGGTSENVLQNHTSYAAYSKAELANDKLMETVYTSRSINFQFGLSTSWLHRKRFSAVVLQFMEFWWLRRWRLWLWGGEKHESTASESKLNSMATQRLLVNRGNATIFDNCTTWVLLWISFAFLIVQIFGTWHESNKLNKHLSWLKGSSHFKSLNFEQMAGHPFSFTVTYEIKFTSIMWLDCLKITGDQSNIDQPFSYYSVKSC